MTLGSRDEKIKNMDVRKASGCVDEMAVGSERYGRF